MSRSPAQILTGRRRDPAARGRAARRRRHGRARRARSARDPPRRSRARAAHLRRGARRGVGDGARGDRRPRGRAGRGLVPARVHEPPPAGSRSTSSGRRVFSGDADGTISCSMDGVAHSAFRYAKIGFNVHHPLLETVGRRYRAATLDGELVGRIERQIEPQRVVDGTLTAMFPPYSELAIAYGDGQEVVFSFAGDLFELQDHRNWSDGNFKSYGTPLSVPWPMDAEPGQRFRQRVLRAAGGHRRGPGRGRSDRAAARSAPRASACPRSVSGAPPEPRSTSTRQRSCSSRGHGTCGSRCACTRRASPTSSRTGSPTARASAQGSSSRSRSRRATTSSSRASRPRSPPATSRSRACSCSSVRTRSRRRPR